MRPLMTLHAPRPYQAQLISGVYTAWQNVRNVLAVLPTGGGKSMCLSHIAAAEPGAVAVVAHRAELVSQLSVALGREGVPHRVIGPATLQRTCVQSQLDDGGHSYYDPNARVAVCSVNTLVRMKPNDPWLAQVRLWITDECHHVTVGNMWGDACAMFPNARGLGVTATPLRADGKGLGRHADGVFDEMVVGPTMRELIRSGFLSDYRVISAPSDLDLSDVPLSASGDYSPPKLSAARRRSRITGDVVREYLRHAPGKLGVTFDVDIDAATNTADAFRAAGVPAEVVSSKTPDSVRASIMRNFKARRILQIVNVDLLGEGVDVPAIEVVSFARPTHSYGLFVQQMGRGLRLMEGKAKAIIIDHVGNVMRHGLPDRKQHWTLDRRDKRSKAGPSDAIPMRTCLNEECLAPYERIYDCCPHCGTPAPPPAGRSAPEQVDGDLVELDEATLARMRGEIDRIDSMPVIPPHIGMAGGKALLRHHMDRAATQIELRAAIAMWGGVAAARLGYDTRQQQRAFFFKFSVDVGTAQTLNAADAGALLTLVRTDLEA
jgi:superfamily II DNA or RNA helicase